MKNPLPMKERIKIPRQHMPEQAPLERRRNFDEVNLGLDSGLRGDRGLALHRVRRPASASRAARSA